MKNVIISILMTKICFDWFVVRGDLFQRGFAFLMLSILFYQMLTAIDCFIEERVPR